jgi:protein TonB
LIAAAADSGGVDTVEIPVVIAAAELPAEAQTIVTAPPYLCESCGSPALPDSSLCGPCCAVFSSVLEPEPDADQSESLTADAARNEAVTVLESAVGTPAPIEPVVMTASSSAVETDQRPWWERQDAGAPQDGPAGSEAETFIAPSPIGRTAAMTAVPEPISAAPDADQEPKPWWERQYDASDEPVLAEPAFVPRGPSGPTAYTPPPLPVPPPAPPMPPAPPVSLAYSNGVPVESPSRRTVQPRVARPIPMAPRVRKSRGALVAGAIVLATAAVGAPLAWKFSGIGSAVSTEATAPVPDVPEAIDIAPPKPAARPRPRPASQVAARRPEAEASSSAKSATTAKPRRPGPAKAAVPVPVPAAPSLSATALSTTFVPTVASAPAPPPPPPVQEEVAPAGPVFEVAQVDMRPEIASRVDAVLPSHLTSRRVEDVVVLRVLVTSGGAPGEIRVLRRARVDAALDAAAITAVRQWRFTPARKKGQAVRCWYNIGVSFSSAGE